MAQNLGISTRTILDLPVASSVSQNDLTVISAGGITKTTTLGQIANLVTETQARVAINIEDYGPVGNGDPDEDTLAWTRALAASASLSLPVVGSGDFYIKVDVTTTIGMYSGASTLPSMFGAIQVPSGAAVDGSQGITFYPFPVSTPNDKDRCLLFYTPQPIKSGGSWTIPVQGAVSSITFKNCTFKFDSAIGSYPSFTYIFGMCGVDNFVCENNTYTYNSAVSVAQNKRGRGGYFSNCINRRVSNPKYLGVGQGQFVVYDYNSVIEDVYAVSCSEVIDLDAPCYGVNLTNLWAYKSEGEADVIDTGGGKGCNFTNIYCYDTGRIIGLYPKQNMFSNFTRWVEAESNTPVSAGECQIATSFNITNVTGVSCDRRAGEEGAITVGQDRPDDYRYPDLPDPRDITFRNISLKHSTGMMIAGADNITVDRFSATSCRGIVRDDNPVLGIIQSAASAGVSDFTNTSGTFTNIFIDTCDSVGMRIESPSRQTYDNVVVQNYGRAAVSSGNVGIKGVAFNRKKGLVTFKSITVGGGVSGSMGLPTDFDIKGQVSAHTTSAGPNRIAFVGPFRFTTSGGNPPSFQNNIRYNIVYPEPETYLVESVTTSIAATVGAGLQKPMRIQPRGTRSRFLTGSFASTSAITSATNYSSITAYVQRSGTVDPISGTTTPYDNQNWNPGAVVSVGQDEFGTDAIVSAGNIFGYRFIRNNSGSALSNVIMNASFFTWSTQVSNGY